MKKILLFLALLLTHNTASAKYTFNDFYGEERDFKIERVVTFYNTTTGERFLTVKGFCFIQEINKEASVTCKVGEGKHKRHTLYLSKDVTYYTEQINTH